MNIELLRLEVLEQIRLNQIKYRNIHSKWIPPLEIILQKLHDDIDEKFDREKNNTFLNRFKKNILKRLGYSIKFNY